MFLGSLSFLRAGGMKVSLNEWLALMEGMYEGFHGQTLGGFYILCRALLVKRESDLDKFERLFDEYFRNITGQQLKEEIEGLRQDPQRARQLFAGYLEDRSLEPDAAVKVMEERLAAVEAGTGEEPGLGAGEVAGGMIQGAGGKSIVHARGDRRFRDWRTDCAIESRQFQMAFRLLRDLSRKLESSEKELDIWGTVDHTCRRGGILDIRTQPPRRNRLKLMVLIDSGGSMRPYEQLCSLLFQSLHKANTFSELKMYYFHNCLEGELYEDPSIDADRTVRTDWILRNISSDYKVIFVGDADMAIHELMGASGGSYGSYGGPAGAPTDGLGWFRRFREKYSHSIWLHPQEREENPAWMSESFVEIGKVFPMFRLSIDGLKDGMYKLLRG